ncbi:MAG TPA: EamA family transporter [Kofleriaceae bacterium]
MTSKQLSRPAAHALLHVTVLLWGFTAILGHQISIHAIPLVWYRILFVAVMLAVILTARREPLRASLRSFGRAAVVGAFIGIHWLCFYGSIKQAGIAIAVLTLSTLAFFTALIEPIVYRRRVDVGEVVIGGVVVVGVALLVQLQGHPDPFGVALGFGSALFSSIFGVLNGKLAPHEPPMRLLFHEMLAALAVVTIAFIIVPGEYVAPSQLSHADLWWLGVLAFCCTVVPQVWALIVLRTLSPFTIAVCVNLETVYALVLGALLYPETEKLSAKFYAGAAILLALVVLNGARKSLQIAQHSNTDPQDRLRTADPS